MENIQKVSNTEVKIIKTIPEIPAVPERTVEEVVTLKALKAQLEAAKAEKVRWTVYRTTPVDELAKIDGEITSHTNLIAKLEAQITEAESQGVVEEEAKVEVVEEEVII